MNRSAVTILLSLFLACLGYQLFIYYKPYFPIFDAKSFELWTVIIACALVPVAAILLMVASVTQPKSTRRRQPQPTAKRPNLSRKEEKLYRQLVNLLHGDTGAAKRLLHGSYTVWNLEKVIHDLVRDRSR